MVKLFKFFEESDVNLQNMLVTKVIFNFGVKNANLNSEYVLMEKKFCFVKASSYF